MTTKPSKVGYLPSADDVERYLSWAHATFVGADPQINVLKLQDETDELVEDPRSADEMADVLMVLLFQASLTGVDLAGAFRAKLRRNLERKWGRNENGTYSHIRGAS